MNKLFDLRFIIGSFFLVVGILLFGYAFFVSGADIERTKTIDHFCGAAFMIFGIAMILLSMRKDKPEPLAEEDK